MGGLNVDVEVGTGRGEGERDQSVRGSSLSSLNPMSTRREVEGLASGCSDRSRCSKGAIIVGDVRKCRSLVKDRAGSIKLCAADVIGAMETSSISTSDSVGSTRENRRLEFNLNGEAAGGTGATMSVSTYSSEAERECDGNCGVVDRFEGN